MHKCLILNIDEGELVKRSLGAYRIATYLRENNWDAEVIEFAAHWSFEQLKILARQRIDKNTKFIGLSCLFVIKPIEVIDQFGYWLKQNYPHIKIILGSPNKYRFDHDYIDYNIHGFGEKALLKLLKYLFSNGPVPKFINSEKNIDANQSVPSYPMKSLMVKYEDRDFIQPHEWLGVEFSRGCKFACAYCNFPVLGVKGDYTRDSEDFKEQLEEAYNRYGVTNYYVSDETFNDRTEKITKFADVVENLSFQPFFTGFIRPDLLVSRPREKEELLRMNFLGQFYGIESFNRETGKLIGKGIDPEKLKHGLLEVRNYFESHGTKRFRATISLIVGLPKETQESLTETKNWLLNNWQGQSYISYPLEIPISEYDSRSKIGMNWAKYGYRDARYRLQKTQLDRVNLIHNGFLYWENDIMDIVEADTISKNIESHKYKKENDFRQGNYSLLRLGLPTNIDENLKLSETEGASIDLPKEFISSYIEKKLNL